MATGSSRKRAAELIETGAVSVNGSVVESRSARLAAGDQLVVDYDEPENSGPVADPDVDVAVIWEDEHLLVVDKAAGLVVHPGAGNPDRTLVNGLLAKYPAIASVGDPERPGIVHRLDRGTTGLMLVALTPASYDGLVSALAARSVGRTYLALAWGEADAAGVIDSPVGRSARQPTKMTVTPRGKPARTHYETLERFTDPATMSLLDCRLETGRTHQIRVHLAAIGHAVVGDAAYGGSRPALEFGRPALHARRLELAHPISGEPLAFEAPTPPDLQNLLEILS
jgi:23S rRNA pseudouridine1911/1915/1917 synthase